MKKDIIIELNGEDFTLSVDDNATLLDVLRDDLALTGTKKGCDTAPAAPAPSSWKARRC